MIRLQEQSSTLSSLSFTIRESFTVLLLLLSNCTDVLHQQKGDYWKIDIPEGAIRIVFAYPADVGPVKSVVDVNGMGAEIKTAFKETEVMINGANGYEAKAYRVYYLDYAFNNNMPNKYIVTL